MGPQQRSQEKNTASHKRDKTVNLNASLDHALGGKKERVRGVLLFEGKMRKVENEMSSKPIRKKEHRQ